MKKDYFLNNHFINAIVNYIWPNEALTNDYRTANNAIIKQVHESSLKLMERDALQCATGIKQFYDPIFPDYNANCIPNSNYIAAEGPNDIGLDGRFVQGCLARFFKNILFNPFLSTQLILAIGHYGSSNIRGDFAHYFAEGTHYYPVANQKQLSYTVRSQKLPGVINEYELMVENPNKSEKLIRVIWIPIADLQPIPHDPVIISSLINAYKLSRMEPLLIHCAAGVGRTGTVILAFKILENYSVIFSDPDPVTVAYHIQNILIDIRKIRPAFITTKKQLESAIQTALNIGILINDE